MDKKVLVVLIAAGFMALSQAARAEIKGMNVEYMEGNAVLQGYAVYDDAITGQRPGILIVHQWMGLTDYEKMRAEMLAKLGYSVLCADIYGKGIRAKDGGEAGKLAGKYRSDRKLLRKRVQAGLKALKKMKQTDPKNTAVIGYCFGGTTALELARSGADVKGAVSFHGTLDTPMPAEKGRIKAKVLVLHGADDKNISGGELQTFMNEMRNVKADWHLTLYGNAVHGFTQPDAGGNTASNFAYDEKADKRSWAEMKDFFTEIFRQM